METTTEKGKEIARRPGTGLAPEADKQFSAMLGIRPTTIAEALAIAKVIADSDLVPKDYKGKPANVLIAWEISSELGIPPIQGMQNISVINGRAAVWGELATAIVQRHALTESLQFSTAEEVAKTGKAWTRMTRKDRPGMVYEYSFSREDAKTAGLLTKEGTWRNYPNWMLQMRANAFCYKMGAADMLKGLTVAEEAMDYIDVTPVRDSERPKIEPPKAKNEKPKAGESQGPDEPKRETAAWPTCATIKVARLAKTNRNGKEWVVIRDQDDKKYFVDLDSPAIIDLAREAKEKEIEVIAELKKDGEDNIIVSLTQEA